MLTGSLPLANYFPETVEKELQRYPRIKALRQIMAEIGFIELQEVVARQPYESDGLGSPLRKKPFQPCMSSRKAFQEGLERMRADLDKGPIQAVSHYLLLWGRKV